MSHHYWHRGFIDVSSAMIEGDHVRPDIMSWDRINMNEKGYEIWTRIIRPVLEEMSQ